MRIRISLLGLVFGSCIGGGFMYLNLRPIGIKGNPNEYLESDNRETEEPIPSFVEPNIEVAWGWPLYYKKRIALVLPEGTLCANKSDDLMYMLTDISICAAATGVVVIIFEYILSRMRRAMV